jgi:hypothetical protein
MRRMFFAFVAAAGMPMLVSCGSEGPNGPSSAAMTQFVEALRGRGYSVSVGGEISTTNMGFFSVPAREVRVNAGQILVFSYSSADRAAAEAQQITHDADPSPAIHPLWASRPQFYRQGALIVLYVGCMADVLQGLEAILGAPLATGTGTPCRGGL